MIDLVVKSVTGPKKGCETGDISEVDACSGKGRVLLGVDSWRYLNFHTTKSPLLFVSRGERD